MLGETGIGASAQELLVETQKLGLEADPQASVDDCARLLEGWASAAAYEMTVGLATQGQLDIDRLIAGGRLPQDLRAWFVNLLHGLEEMDLARYESGHWSVIRDVALPRSISIVKALYSEYPGRAAELLVAAEMTRFVERVVQQGFIEEPSSAIVTKAPATSMNCMRSHRQILPGASSKAYPSRGAGCCASSKSAPTI